MHVLDFEQRTPLLIQQPNQDRANRGSAPVREPALWSAIAEVSPEVYVRSNYGSGEDTVGVIYGGETVVELVVDELSVENDKPVILWVGRPEYWGEDCFNEDKRRAHYEHGFRSAFQKIAQVNPNVEEITVSIDKSFINDVVIGCGRPKGWLRSFICWGKDYYGIIRSNQTSEDAEDALKWIQNGGKLEIVYSRPLQSVGQAAVGAYQKAV